MRFTLKTAFSPFIAQLAHPSTVMISPAALKQWGNKDIAFHPVGTGPFKFVEWKATDYLKVAKFNGYWRKGYPKVDTITWKPVVDNNSRAALMQTGEAHFTFPVPYEVAEVLKAKPDLEIVAAPSDRAALSVDEHAAKPFDNPKVRQAIATRSTRTRSRRLRSAATRRRRWAWRRKALSTQLRWARGPTTSRRRSNC